MNNHLEASARIDRISIREIFRRARQASPCVIFFDEIDSIAPTRGGGMEGGVHSSTERMVSQLLTEMDGIQKEIHGVVVLAATNRVDMIDTALLKRRLICHITDNVVNINGRNSRE